MKIMVPSALVAALAVTYAHSLQWGMIFSVFYFIAWVRYKPPRKITLVFIILFSGFYFYTHIIFAGHSSFLTGEETYLKLRMVEPIKWNNQSATTIATTQKEEKLLIKSPPVCRRSYMHLNVWKGTMKHVGF